MTNQNYENTITIVNLTHPENINIFTKLKEKLGSITDELTLFAYQNGQEPLLYRYHEKQKRLFVIYPRFNIIINLKQALIFLKRKGESYPSICYKIKKSDVEKVLVNDVLNEYINRTVDIREFIQSPLTNESNVVLDNLKITVLLKSIQKDRDKENNNKQTITYADLFEKINDKLNEVIDGGYLELLNKTCVMLWETWSNPNNVNFKALSLNTPKTKVITRKNDSNETIIKDIVKTKVPKIIPNFNNPTDVPKLENILDDQKELIQTTKE